MSCNWPRVQISEVCELIVDCVNKTAPRVDYETPFKMIRTPNVKGGKISLNDCRFVEEDTYEKWTRRAKVLRDDVLLTREAPMGEVGIVDFDDTVFLGQRIMQYRVDRSKLDPHFLLYSFLSSDLQHQFNMHEGSGSVVSHIRVPDCSKFELNLPPLNIQKEIADVLKKLDRKISVNQQTNQTLEEVAQAIFKSWFVDFDPVKAKMNGEQPEGMDAATASLFPEKLVESELGLIPEGWEPKQLKDILELAYGKALKKTDRVEGDVPVYGSGGLTGYHNQSLVEGPGIIVGRKGTVGSVYWEPKSFYPIDTVFYVKPKAGYSLNYCYLILQNLGLENMNTDAAVPGLNRNNAYRLEVVTPSQDVLKKFESLMHSFQSKVDSNNAENSSLETLRDTLLPKLLSGEITLD
ncbi:restriction endonuclease subunit S [Vibrio cholerae]|nr:restriction endonuclease subunit S [Vibrio cholerae]EGR0776913.1 restriction endonuclease subunit S [Vibrio cholerae]EGR0780696.1 restriction endonuclease subunit S [Vibrio cholerae]EGR0822984.1 restriction endonuclease subunit S [Vibrio cholerae]EGR0831351.1 restriction endonuclease subunit S [Vibrio cholerae]